MSLLISGGGLKTGQVIGSTNPKGEEPASRQLLRTTFWATVYRAMGVPLDIHFTDFTGRPVPIVPNGQTDQRVVLTQRRRVLVLRIIKARRVSEGEVPTTSPLRCTNAPDKFAMV